MLNRLIPAVLVAAAVVPATASAAGGYGQTTFKVVKATHTSSVTKAEENYSGHSDAHWSLAKATNLAPNRVIVSRTPTMTTGLGQVNISGAYNVDVSTDRAHCAFTAPTGTDEYPASAPTDFTLAIGPDPNTGKGIFASFMAVQATLGNAYLGSECSTSVSGEPDPEQTSIVAVTPKTLKKKKVVLRFKGSSSEDNINATWSTTIVLKRR